MSEADYHTLAERCLRPSPLWTPFPHADDLFTHAHRMLIGDDPPDDPRESSAAPPPPPPPPPPPAAITTKGEDSSGLSRSASFRVHPPPLLPMSPGIAEVVTASSSAAPSRRGGRNSPPPLLPMPTAEARAPPPPPPPSLLATPPSTPPPGGSSCHAEEEEEEEERQLKKRVCGVCGDVARSLHFGGLACDSCKAFFRRAVLGSTFADFTCRRDHRCAITVGSRRSCQACRFAGCLRAGMRVSLAKREDETRRVSPLQSLDLQRRQERLDPSIRTRERPQGKSLHVGPLPPPPAHAAAAAAGSGLSPGFHGSLVPEHERLSSLEPGSLLPPAPEDSPSPFRGFACDFDAVVRQARLGRGSHATRGHLAAHHHHHHHHPSSTTSFGAARRYSPISSNAPATIDGLYRSHASAAIHRPSSSHTPTKSHSPTRNHKLSTGQSPENRSHGESLNFPLLQASMGSLSPSTSNRRSPYARSPVTQCLGVQPGPPAAEERLVSPSGSTSSKVSSPTSDGELDSPLEHHDQAEITELQESYSSTFDVKSLPVGERMVRSEEVSKLYTCFIQRRARFLVSTPLYRSLAQRDRLKLLHVAVAMSTYFTGAHLIDTRDYTWRNHSGVDGEKTFPVMSASTIRQFLSHEQFVYVMRFYTTYSPVFSDQTVAILMQVLSLFYPEPGLEDPEAAERGRLHYIALLSRYLRAMHGPRLGSERLRTLIGSQQEARQLVDLLQHVELTPQAPRVDAVDSQKNLVEGIQLVCNNARESLAKGVRERPEGFAIGASGGASPVLDPQTAAVPENTTPVQDEERLDFIGRTFNRLANCEDPYILAEARRILPADLVRRFFQQLQCSSASDA